MIANQYVIISLIGNVPNDSDSIGIINGYNQPISSMLIRNSAINFFEIDEQFIKILAYGKEEDYDVCIHMDNKFYYQIDKDNFFQININTDHFKFDYFLDYNYALDQVDKMITASPLRDVILFLDDHDNKGYFSEITYFRLYNIIMKHQNTKFFIFNDSCFSGSFIDLVQAYDKLYELKTKNKEIFIDINMLFAFRGIFEFLLLNNDVEQSIKKVKGFINLYQNIKIQNESMFKKIINFKIPKEDNTS